jgi:glycosyltransferase involved in cell wall biosynthesis
MTQEQLSIFKDIVKRADSKRLGQQQYEWKEFLKFTSSYFRTRGVEKPIVVELGVWFNGQQEYYEKILNAEYIGMDISNKNVAICGNSHKPETLEKLKQILNGRQIDLLFIDGDHSLEGVTKDYNIYSPLVKHIIAFHDITTAYDTDPKDPVHVVDFWKELEKSNKVDTLMTIYRYNSLGNNKFAPGRQMGIGLVIKQPRLSETSPLKKTKDLTVYSFAVCMNEEKMLPYYLKHYENIVDKMVILDGGSTDKSIQILKAHPKVELIIDKKEKQDEYYLMKFRDEYYQKYKNIADFAIIGDIDEFLIVNREMLQKYKNEGVTIPKVVGYQMVSYDFPVDKEEQIYSQINTGFADPKWMNKNAIFDPQTVKINYEMGCHKCNPVGQIKYSQNELKLLHYKCVGYEYLVEKSKKSANRLDDKCKQQGLAFQYALHANLSKDDFNKLLQNGKVFEKNVDGSKGKMVTFTNADLLLKEKIDYDKHLSQTYKVQWNKMIKDMDNQMGAHWSDCKKVIYNPDISTKVNIVIPTLGLREPIMDTIDCLLTSTYENINIVVYIQENDILVDKLRQLYVKEKVEIIFEPKRIGWVKANNNIAKRPGHLFALADDVAMTRDVVEILVAEMNRLFPDKDGVLGTNLTYTASYRKDKIGFAYAFPFIGDKFINRFPDRQVLCPDYKAYSSDVELPEFAVSIKKSFIIPDAKVIHFERRTIDKDQTSIIARKAGLPDIEKYFKRQQRGYLWGKDFSLLG